MSSSADSTPPDVLATMRGDLETTIARILGSTEILQQQASDLGQETFLPDLQRIQGAGKHLTELVQELMSCAVTRLEDVDYPRLRFEVRGSLNHIVGYIEMLQERSYEFDQRGFLPDLDKIHAGCRQLLAQTETAAAQQHGEGASISGGPSGGLDIPGVDGKTPQAGTLLVVDDNIQNRELLGRQLRSIGYRVVHAGSGPSAMERIRAHKFDLILLDVVMPGMSGYEVLQWLKADAILRHIPVLMISAVHDTENVVRCLVIGADDYVAKPFDPVLLKVRVNASLERARWRHLEESYQRQIAEERARSERLLLNMLPESTVQPS